MWADACFRTLSPHVRQFAKGFAFTFWGASGEVVSDNVVAEADAEGPETFLVASKAFTV